MVDFLKFMFFEIPADMWSDGGFWRILGIVFFLLMLLLAIIIVYVIVAGLYSALDKIAVKRHKFTATIRNKEFSPGDYGAAYAVVVPVFIPPTPPSWHLLIELDLGAPGNLKNLFNWMSVGKSFYENVDVGQRVEVEYKAGRLSRKPHFTYVKYVKIR